MKRRFVICLRNDACDDLEVGKVYWTLADSSATTEGYVRVIDDSGEDYLYPTASFVFIDVPRSAERLLAAARNRRRPRASSPAKRSGRRAG